MPQYVYRSYPPCKLLKNRICRNGFENRSLHVKSASRLRLLGNKTQRVIGSNTVMTSVIVERVTGSFVTQCSTNSLRFLFHINAICRSLSSGFGVWLVQSSQRSTPKLYTSIYLWRKKKQESMILQFSSFKHSTRHCEMIAKENKDVILILKNTLYKKP